MRSFIEGHLGQNATLGIHRSSARTVEAFNSWADSTGRSDEKLAGMACTLTALVLRGRQVHVIHVGDTRAYRWRDGRLDQMTTDHAMAGAGLQHILTRAIGAEESIRIDYAADTLRLYDRYLLCSDGIHGGVANREIAEILARRNAPDGHGRGEAAESGDVSLRIRTTCVLREEGSGGQQCERGGDHQRSHYFAFLILRARGVVRKSTRGATSPFVTSFDLHAWRFTARTGAPRIFHTEITRLTRFARAVSPREAARYHQW